jgi:sterol-4alpha-carboxylate 3-dehydrogenase (decarboxylating)
MSAKRVLVTGGGGFVGGEIIRALITKHPEFELSVLDIQPLSADLLQKADVSFFHADISDAGAVLKAVQAAKPDIVVHSAGIVPTRDGRYSQKNRDATFKINVAGTKNVLDASKQCRVKYFVFTSSITVITDDVDNDYPNVDETTPTGRASLTYGASKVRICMHNFTRISS